MSHFPVRPVSYLSRLLLVSFDILSIPLEIIEIELRRVRARTWDKNHIFFLGFQEAK